MRILAIETSCDETAVCIIEAEGDFGRDFNFRVLGNSLVSQAALHSKYGGVFPNLAKREHAKNLVPLTTEALRQAGAITPPATPVQGLPLDTLGELLSREPELLEQMVPFLEGYAEPKVDAIAVTYGPGLEPALWVGINFAKALALVWGLPIVGVNHMEGHIMMSMMEIVSPSHPASQLASSHTSPSTTTLQSKVEEGRLAAFEFPVLSLLISGGHTELVLSTAFGSYEVVGETRDDAAGEAFDKVARLLGLPYPGGPEVSRLAAEARNKGFETHFKFTRPMMHEKHFDFSFSGLKTAVRNAVIAAEPLTDDARMQIAREFEECVADVLITKTLRAAEEFGASTLVVGGGVSANTFIRSELARRMHQGDALMHLLVPPPELATDNALMIALVGYFHAKAGTYADAATLAAVGNLRLETEA
jgi:N6-L-threonylcarbamoyladenine synthase